MNKQIVELLAPAGNMEKLKIAFAYGADAVYLAGKNFGLRTFAGNFEISELKEAVNYAHNLNKKVYVTVNIYADNKDLETLADYLINLYEISVDAIIISDPGIFAFARKVVPGLEVHISTQANTTNWASCEFWQKQGASRIVLAREVSLTDIKEINQKVPVELEVFVHGAMCMSYSGRCMLSSFLTGRSGNKGSCTHPCRWKYHVVEEQRPGEYLPLEEDERGTYIFNSKDLCMLPYIPQLIDAGIKSFKIEGRMKSMHYVATIVKAYREAIDGYLAQGEKYIFNEKLLNEVKKVSEREYTTGFFFTKPDSQAYNYETNTLARYYDFAGLIVDYDKEKQLALVEQRNKFTIDDELEVFGPSLPRKALKIDEMFNEDGEKIDSAPHPQQKVYIKTDFPLEINSILRVIRK